MLRGMEENPYEAPRELGGSWPAKRARRQPKWVFFASLLMCVLCGFLAVNMARPEDARMWAWPCFAFGGMAVVAFIAITKERDGAA